MCNWLTNYVYYIFGITSEKTYKYEAIDSLNETHPEPPSYCIREEEESDEFFFIDDDKIDKIV